MTACFFKWILSDESWAIVIGVAAFCIGIWAWTKAFEDLSPRVNQREQPSSLQAEPSYGLPDEVGFSIRCPDWTIHRINPDCQRDDPHMIKDCGLWNEK